MNLIFICADTFRNDHLGCMGNPIVKTPCLDKLASEGVLFENAHAEALPTIPERLVFMTGKFIHPFRSWEPLGADDITIAEHLGKHGWRTGFVADCYHYFKPGCNFHRGFDEWRWIRGQETDKFVCGDVEIDDPFTFLPDNTLDIPGERKHLRKHDSSERIADYLRNTADRGDDESEYFPAQTIGESMKWLERNREAEKFMLWIELFDPHEPFDPPPKYYDMYRNPDYDGPRIMFPWYHSLVADDYTAEQLEDIRALYAGEVSMVDHWIGKLVDKVDELGLREETIVFFTSDHGTLFGERGCVSKTQSVRNTLSRHIANLPLIVSHPNAPKGIRVEQPVWSPDYMPTFCEMLGVDPPETAHGRGFWKVVDGDTSAAREYTITSWPRPPYHYVADADWRFIHNNGKEPDELYRFADDREELRNVAEQHPEVCAMMIARIEQYYEDAARLGPLARDGKPK